MFEENTSFTSDKTSAEACDVRGLPKLSIGESFCRHRATDHECQLLFYLPQKRSNVHAEENVQCLWLQSRVFICSLRCSSRAPLSSWRLLLLREPVTSRTGSPSLWEPSSQDGGMLFLCPWKIYILLYSSSIVWNVRIHVVDGRRGDFSQLQNSWITSKRFIYGPEPPYFPHILLTCSCILHIAYVQHSFL